MSLISSTMPASTVTSSAGGRLVEQQQRRVRQQRHGDDDALLLAARDLVRIGVHDPLRVGQRTARQHLERALAAPPPRAPARGRSAPPSAARRSSSTGSARPSAPGRPSRSREPRSWRSSSSLIVGMSRPSNLISPRQMRPFLPRYCMMASATVDLPQPDSPTMPDASPGMSFRLKSTTAGISPGAREIGDAEVLALQDRRLGSHRPCRPVSRCRLISRRPSASRLKPRIRRRDRERRDQRHVGELDQHRSTASLIIRPQSGSGGGRPRPRKPSVAMAIVV